MTNRLDVRPMGTGSGYCATVRDPEGNIAVSAAGTGQTKEEATEALVELLGSHVLGHAETIALLEQKVKRLEQDENPDVVSQRLSSSIGRTTKGNLAKAQEERDVIEVQRMVVRDALAYVESGRELSHEQEQAERWSIAYGRGSFPGAVDLLRRIKTEKSLAGYTEPYGDPLLVGFYMTALDYAGAAWGGRDNFNDPVMSQVRAFLMAKLKEQAPHVKAWLADMERIARDQQDKRDKDHEAWVAQEMAREANMAWRIANIPELEKLQSASGTFPAPITQPVRE